MAHPPMDPTDPDFLAHLRAESARFRAVLEETDPRARVPSCPDWDAEDLLWHLTEVQWFWATIVEERRQSPEGLVHPQRPADRAGLLTLAAEQADRLHRVLADATPETPVWMWADDRTVGYVRRRQAHEALIHRLDAELVAGTVTALDADLAADGVRECLEVMYGGVPDDWGTFTPTGGPVRVEATDRPGAGLTVRPGRFVGTDPDDGTAYDEGVLGASDDDPAATVTGTADDLDTWLWHRRGDDAVTLAGDPDALDAFRDVVRRPLT